MWKPVELLPTKAIAFPFGDQAAPPTSTPSGQPELRLWWTTSPASKAKNATAQRKIRQPQRRSFSFGIGLYEPPGCQPGGGGENGGLESGEPAVPSLSVPSFIGSNLRPFAALGIGEIPWRIRGFRWLGRPWKGSVNQRRLAG